MRTADTIVFVEDPGAAVFVARLSAEPGIRLLAMPPAAGFLKGLGTPAVEVSPESAAEYVTAFLQNERPSVLVVGTSTNVKTPAFEMVRVARNLGVTTVGVVDAAVNADARFRGTTENPLKHAPDWLIVADDATRDAFVALGYPPTRVAVCGNPQFETAVLTADALEGEGRDVVRRRLLSAEATFRPVVLFAAEVSAGGLNPDQHRRSTAYTLAGNPSSSGRMEVVLDEFLFGVESLEVRPFLVLRLHPKANFADLEKYAHRFDHVSAGGSALELVFASDLVVGMTSMLMMEAALMGVPTLSIVPRAEEATWLPSVAAGWTPQAVTRDEVNRLMRAQLAAAPGRPAFNVDGAHTRMVGFLRNLRQGNPARESSGLQV